MIKHSFLSLVHTVAQRKKPLAWGMYW